MKDQSIFGETRGGQPFINLSAGARTQTRVPCHGLFGAKLLPESGEVPRPGIGSDELPQRSS